MRASLIFVCFAITVSVGCAQSVTNSATDTVIRFLEQRVKNDPDDFIAAGKLGRTYLQKARETGLIDCYAKAEDVFRAALKWTPDSYALRASIGSVLVAQHKFHEAAAMAGKLTTAYPQAASAYGVLGDALLEIGDVRGAAAAYAKLLDLGSGLSAYARLARLDWSRGDVSGAISNLSLSLTFSNSPPESLAWAHVQKGELLFRTGHPTDAGREYSAALQSFHGYYLGLDHIAELRAMQGQFDEAIKSFEQLNQRTGRPEYLQAVGDIYMAARKPAQAKPFYDRALSVYLRETDAGNSHYFHHLAGFYSDVRYDGVEAEKWARRDLEVRQNAYAWDALAWALYWKKDYAAAAVTMKKALASGTRDAQQLGHAGSIFVRAGQIQEGRELMMQAAQVNPHFQDFHVHR